MEEPMAPFDFNELVRRRRKRCVVKKDDVLHGGRTNENRMYGAFSDPQELDELNKELHLQSDTGKYNFDIRKDILLHGSSTCSSRLNGYFSSNEKIDELDKLRLETISKGRIKENRADWSDDTTHMPQGPFERVNRIYREEENYKFGQYDTMMEIKNPCTMPKSTVQKGLQERLYNYYGEKIDGAYTVRKAIGLSNPEGEVAIEARGLTDHGHEPIPVRGLCSLPKQRSIAYQAMVQDPDYKWASDPDYRSPRPQKEKMDLTHMPLGFEGTVPTAVLEQRVEQSKQSGELLSTDLQPYSRDHLEYDIRGYKKETNRRHAYKLDLKIPKLDLSHMNEPMSPYLRSTPRSTATLYPGDTSQYCDYPSTFSLPSGAQTERSLAHPVEAGTFPSPRRRLNCPYGLFTSRS